MILARACELGVGPIGPQMFDNGSRLNLAVNVSPIHREPLPAVILERAVSEAVESAFANLEKGAVIDAETKSPPP